MIRPAPEGPRIAARSGFAVPWGAWGFAGRFVSGATLALLGAGCATETPDLQARPTSRPSSTFPGIGPPPEAGSTEPDDTEGPAGPHGASPEPTTPSRTPEPERDPALTFVNGVLDARFVQLCEADPETGLPKPDAAPQPERGLAFGASLVFTPDGPLGHFWSEQARSLLLIASQQPIEPGVGCAELVERAGAGELVGPGCGAATPDAGARPVAADLDASVVPNFGDASTESSDAGAAALPELVLVDAGAVEPSDAAVVSSDSGSSGSSGSQASRGECLPELSSVPFATFPPGTFSRELSVLLAASGCVGGGRSPTGSACGDAARAGLVPVLAPLSRIYDYRSLGLQLVNASVLPLVTLRSDPEQAEGGLYFTVALDVPRGAIAPDRLRSGIDRMSLGEPADRVALRLEERSGAEPVLSTSWAEIVPPQAMLLDGSGWSFVLLGSSAEADRERAGLRLLLVSNDPNR